MPETDKKIIGWLEKVWFPEFSSPEEGVIAKIDTGADGGALHVVYQELVTDEDGKELLEFQPIDEQHDTVRTDKFVPVRVRSSNSMVERRFRIFTTIRIQDEVYPIQLTLADRTDMKYDVIIGWRFLEDKFLVDVSLQNV